jgi:hypothetical protein
MVDGFGWKQMQDSTQFGAVDFASQRCSQWHEQTLALDTSPLSQLIDQRLIGSAMPIVSRQGMNEKLRTRRHDHRLAVGARRQIRSE